MYMNNAKDISLIQSICIVIPTYNRANILAKALAHYPGIDLIEHAHLLIIDNNSNDNTKDIVDAFVAKTNLKVTYHFEPRQGLSIAKNTALQLCEQAYILFLDDDCYPQADILIQCIQYADKAEVATVGKIKRWNAMVPEWIIDDFFIDNFPSDTPERMMTSRYFKGGILFIATAILVKMNGFDTALGMKGSKSAYGEDSQLAAQLLQANYPITYDPTMVMHHCSHQHSISAFTRAYFGLGKTYAKKTQPGALRIGVKLIIAIAKSPFTLTKAAITYPSLQTAFTKTLLPIATYGGQLAGSFSK
jgi:glycosyltransferase involved in cell wall biosynthesis